MASPKDPNDPWSYVTHRRLEDEPEPYEPLDTRAKAALGLGVAGLVLWMCPVVGCLAGPTAITFGVMAMLSDNPTSKIMGVAGIVLGLICTVMSFVALAILTIFEMGAAAN